MRYVGTKVIWMEPWLPRRCVSGKQFSHRPLLSSSHWRSGNRGPKEVKVLVLGLGMDDACIVGSPAGDLSQTWAGGVGPSCYQAALEACQGLCLLSTILSRPAAFLRTVRPDLNVMQSRAIFFLKAIVLASCHHLCPAMSPPVGLHPYPFLWAGHGCQLPHQPFSIAKEGL